MRVLLYSLTLLLLCVGLFLAAPAQDAIGYECPTRNSPDADNQLFGRQLLNASNQIVDQYVRPVTHAQVLYAALKGLYDKAGRPLPAHFKGDLEEVKTDEATLALLAKARKDCGGNRELTDDLRVVFEAVAASLDPSTKVITADDQRPNAALQAEMVGFGLEIAPHLVAESLRVTVVFPGGPAQGGGLRPGDAITRLNDQAVHELSAEKVDQLLGVWVSENARTLGLDEPALQVPPPLEIAYRRPGVAKEQKTTLEQRHFRTETVLGVSRRDDNAWNYFLDTEAGVAQVRVASLAKGTARELHEVLTELHVKKLRGLVLDLRWCPGGYLDESIDCARLFLDTEKVLTTVKARGRDDVIYRANKEGDFTDFALVVLVNDDTRGGAELIAAALQDHGRARVAGQRSFGKASVQTQVHLGLPYTGMKLTSGTFQRPGGKTLHRFPESKLTDDWGVRPDAALECRLSPEANRALKEAWLLQTLRPGSSRERLVLDDPAMDMPRQTAAAALLAQLVNK